MKIGIFDSGIGGLSVLHLALKYLPNDHFIYYADVKNVPYGEKTREEIIKYVDDIIQFMINKGAQAIVIACNTATSAAIQYMREKYSLPIIGMEPAIKKAIDTYGKHRVLVIATPITIKGEKIHNLVNRVDKHHLVDLVALPKLVHFAENLNFQSDEVYQYLSDELSKYPLDEYSSLVLGCTHFNYFKDTLRSLLPSNIHIIDGNEGTVKHLIEYVTQHENKQSIEFYFSGDPLQMIKIFKIKHYFSRLDEMIKIQ